MALGITRSSGDAEFLPSFRMNSISGDAMIVSSEKNASGEWEKNEKEISFPQKFIFDFDNIEVGWIHFAVNGPSFAMTKIGGVMPAKPTPDHKQGFRVKLFSKEFGVSQFANSSRTVGDAMDILHTEYEIGLKKNPGKVPVVEIKGTKKVQSKTKDGVKNYKQPEWSIVSWVARPEAMAAKVAEPAKTEVADDSDDF